MPRTQRRAPAPAHPRRRRARFTGALAALSLALVLLLSACAGGSSDVPGAKPTPARGPVLNLYAYSVAKPAYDAVTEAYAHTPDSSQVTLLTSYGASGDQSRKVAAGAPADIVSFSITPDVTRLVDAGLVDPHWDEGPDRGVPLSSVVVFVVREGNPKGIHDWSDLLRPGIDVVTPNPLSSGSAQWNLMAPYAVASRGGQDPQAGLDYVRALVAVREVEPVLREIGTDQEQAAATLGAHRFQVFWRITLPSIRWGLTYGTVLTISRALGEYGAVLLVSSNLPGVSQTLTLLVHGRFVDDHNVYGAYAASTVLMGLALLTLLVTTLLDLWKKQR